ncbi:Band 4.1-like protein 4-like [Homarus americanus]|uniref:Band 4.1-like protein 4-like n=1 Tax=Homarus americanus TaxID=6706 RepID=A0A8J5MJG0_HOMAM|nr:Band 4.1-like protein 4-like [Homarus americanus]
MNGEDNIEYFLGLTPSGVIVLRNKAKVGNYFWPRISKVYFRGRFFMLRVRDKNNSENTYGFETPSKAACKHLWQCCVEHHAFFRLTQASGNSPAAIFSLGSKFRYSGRTEKEAVQDAKLGSRTQPEFTRLPSRRYQRRIVEGAQDTPRVEDIEVKPETRNTVQLPTPVSTVSHMYRSTSMTLAPRSDSPRSTRSAPYPAGVTTSGGTATLLGGRKGDHRTRGESPRSVHSAAPATHNYAVSRRTSSVDSQSSVDSRGHRRHRRSRGRSSDGESEASSKCSSRGHRRHRHRHQSDDSDHHRHRHRRRRHKSGGTMVNSDTQWVQVQAGEAQVRGSTATVRDLSHKSGYQPSGIDTEADSHHHQHSNKKRHRKHRSRSRSPSEAKNTRLPDELRRHLEFDLQKTQGLTEAELREIPYTKIETAKTIKIKYTSPKTKRHKSPRRSKSNSSDRKATPPADGESPPPPYTPSPSNKTNTLPKANHKDSSGEVTGARTPDGGGLVNGTLRPPGPRSVQAPTVAVSRVKSSEGLSSGGNSSRGSSGDSPGVFRSHNDSSTNTGMTKTSASTSTSTSCTSYGFTSSTSHKPVMVNGPSVKALVTNSANGSSPTLGHEASSPDSSAFMEETTGGFVAANGFVPTSAAILKNGTNERGSHFTAVLKPQPSPQSSVTSGISVGSSSVSISADSTLTRGSQHNCNKDTSHNHHHQLSSASNSPDPDDQKNYDHHSYENFSFDHNSYDNSTICDSPEPYYNNCSSHCDQKKSGQHDSLYPSLEPMTQHSTNILIHYHDLDSVTSSSQPSSNQPVPLPRSSIISSVHSNDSSTHIVQSYGPSMSGSKNDTNPLQRSGYTSAPPKPRSNSNPNSVGLPPFSSSMSSSPAPSASSVTGCGNSSLPRPSSNRPHMRTTGSQTNILRTTASQTNHSNLGQRASSKPQSSSKATEMSHGIQTTNGTNLAHSALHWKVYNWDAYREEAEWSNSLGRSIKGQGSEGNQASTAVVSDTNGYHNGSYDHMNVAVNGKVNGLGKKNGSISGIYMNGKSNSKTCLAMNSYSPKSKGLAPLSDEFIHINSKINGNNKNSMSNFTGGDANIYKTDYITGSVHEHVNTLTGGKGTGHLKTFTNGHVNGFINGHTKDHRNGSINSCFEVESKNNKNVTFKVDSSLLRNSKGNGLNVTVNGKLEDNHLKGDYKGDAKGKLNGEAADEISTEL